MTWGAFLGIVLALGLGWLVDAEREWRYRKSVSEFIRTYHAAPPDQEGK